MMLPVAAAEGFVYDQADQLTAEEIVQLEQLASEWSQDANTELVIVTTTGVTEGQLAEYLAAFKNEHNLGANYDGNVAMIGIAPDTRDVTVSSFGPNKDILSDSRLDWIRDDVTSYLTADDLVGGFSHFMERTATEIIEYEPYDGDVFFNKWWFHLLIAMSIALTIMWIWIYRAGGVITDTESHYIDNGQSRIVSQKDDFICTVVTQTTTSDSDSDSGSDSSYNSSSGKY